MNLSKMDGNDTTRYKSEGEFETFITLPYRIPSFSMFGFFYFFNPFMKQKQKKPEMKRFMADASHCVPLLDVKLSSYLFICVQCNDTLEFNPDKNHQKI